MTNSIHTDEMLILRNWLKTARKTRSLTMHDLAAVLDKPHSFVQKVEQGERRLDVIEYIWYCHALKINPQEGLALVEQLLLSKL